MQLDPVYSRCNTHSGPEDCRGATPGESDLHSGYVPTYRVDGGDAAVELVLRMADTLWAQDKPALAMMFPSVGVY